MTEFSLSERQKNVVATAITLLSGLFVLGAVAFSIWVLGVFLSTFSGVLLPLAVAGIAALVMKPYYEWIRQRLGGRSIWAVCLVYASLVVPLVGFLWVFGAVGVQQLTGLIGKASEFSRRVGQYALAHGPDILDRAQELQLEQRVRDFLEARLDLVTGAMLGLIQSVFSAGLNLFQLSVSFIGWFVLPVYLGFFLAARVPSRDRVESFFPFLKPETRESLVFLGAEFVHILVSFFRAQLLIALLQGLLYALGFTLIGLQYGFVLGLLLGFMNIVPYLGSLIGLAVALPLAFFQPDGGWSLLLFVVGVFTLVQLIESYLLTPQIMGKRTGLHPLAIIVAIFFWGSVFGGLWGMILAIPLTAFLVVFWRLLREKYMREII